MVSILTQQVPEPTYAALTYVALDEISDEAWAVLAALWLSLLDFETFPDFFDWLDLFVDTFVEAILGAEEIGFVAGSEAAPSSDLLLPVVSDDHTWRKIKDFDPDAAQEALQHITTPKDEPALRERIEKAVVTMVEERAEPKRVERVVRNEVVHAAVEGQSRAIGERKDITGWRRAVETDCCAICFYLWKEGYVYLPSQPMWSHTGCRCSKVPTTDERGLRGRDSLDAAGKALLDRYYAGQIEDTKYTKQQEEA